MSGEARDRAHLEQIVELADLIARRLEGLTSERFGADRDEVDLTAYRLSAFGEATRKLSDQLKSRHPSIPWPAIYAMRNIIGHDYGRLIPITSRSSASSSVKCYFMLAGIPAARSSSTKEKNISSPGWPARCRPETCLATAARGRAGQLSLLARVADCH